MSLIHAANQFVRVRHIFGHCREILFHGVSNVFADGTDLRLRHLRVFTVTVHILRSLWSLGFPWSESPFSLSVFPNTAGARNMVTASYTVGALR